MTFETGSKDTKKKVFIKTTVCSFLMHLPYDRVQKGTSVELESMLYRDER